MARDTGIRTRHSRSCKTRDGGACNCSPSYEAFVFSKRDGKKIRRSFPGVAAARGWRIDAAPGGGGVARGRGPRRVPQRAEQPYEPAVLRNYELAPRLRVLAELGDRNLADIDFAEVGARLRERHRIGVSVSLDSRTNSTGTVGSRADCGRLQPAGLRKRFIPRGRGSLRFPSPA
jgi:hypothetical protein